MRSIGLYGGSFDPVHLGHIGLARQAMTEISLDLLLFIPTKYQPFKLDEKVASEKDRLEMLLRSIKGEPKFQVSEIEFNRDEISYTSKTFFEIKKIYGEDVNYFFILGTDAFLSIEMWYQAGKLLSNCNFAVGIRPNEDMSQVRCLAERLLDKYGSEIRFLNNKQLLVSSTDIKDKLKKNQSIGGMVPEPVENYIYEQGLYI